MEARRLGRTGLRVSPLCLGTMQFGWTCDEAMAQRVMDAYVEEDGIFLDSADVYSNWAPGNPGGVAEEIIGRWMRARGNRDRLVVATKVRARVGSGPNDEGLSRKHIVAACEASLRRLGTDYIDLYQAHSDDRDTPLEETLAAFDSLVRQGKVRYVGASNYSAWRLARALWVSDAGDYARYDSLQPHYSLAHREEYERELEPLCRDQQIGVIPYSPLEGGFLSGKYRRGQPLPESARAAGVQRRFMNERGFAVIDALDAVAKDLGATMTQTALAWLLARPGVTAPIIGANSPEQLRELLGALDHRLPPEAVTRLETASDWQSQAP